MTGKLAIVGRDDGISVFQATGVAAFVAEDEKVARELLRKLAREYQVIFLTEDLALPLSDFLKRFDESAYPVVATLPTGANGNGLDVLKMAMERALGVDVLFNK